MSSSNWTTIIIIIIIILSNDNFIDNTHFGEQQLHRRPTQFARIKRRIKTNDNNKILLELIIALQNQIVYLAYVQLAIRSVPLMEAAFPPQRIADAGSNEKYIKTKGTYGPLTSYIVHEK